MATIRNKFIVPLGLLSVGSATKLSACVKCGYVEIYVMDSTDLQNCGEVAKGPVEPW